jgi:hypothetical protein
LRLLMGRLVAGKVVDMIGVAGRQVLCTDFLR